MLPIRTYIFTLQDQPDVWNHNWIMLSWKDWNNKIDFRNNDWSSSIIDRSSNQHSSCHIKWVSLNHELVSIPFLSKTTHSVRQKWEFQVIFDWISGKSFENYVKITWKSRVLVPNERSCCIWTPFNIFFRRYKFHFDNPFFRFCILSLILCVPILTNFSYSQARLKFVSPNWNTGSSSINTVLTTVGVVITFSSKITEKNDSDPSASRTRPKTDPN